MNLLNRVLLEDIIDSSKTVAIYGGGFKPPTKGHYLVVEKTLEQFPEIDELKIFVGGGVRDGITQEESIKIWEIYKPYLSDKIDIEPSVAPVKSILGYAKEHPEEKVYWILGAREGDEDDLKDIENRTKSISKYPNIEVKVITTSGGVSGTKTRAAITSDNKEQFFHMIPDVEQKEEIWDILSPIIKEETEELVEVGEASTTPYKWKEEYDDDMGVEVSFETESGIEYNVILQRTFYNNIPILDVEFIAGVIDPNFGGGMSSKVITNKGELFKVMSTVVDIIKFYVKNTEAQGVTYSPSKKGDETISTNQRNTLYKAFLTKQVPGVEFKQNSDYVVALFPGYVDLEETIKKVGDEYAVYPEKGGKRLGTHKTKSAAEKQLQAIHIQQQKESKDPFGLNEIAKHLGEQVGKDLTKSWNPKESFVSLSKYMIDNGMNIKPLPKIKVIDNDAKNASNLLGKTAYYDPNNKLITLYTLGRHPKDVLRSFAHEMIHHEQNLNGTLGNIGTTNTNEDGHLDEIEREAYEKGNIMLRNWEDSIKNV